jgi:hypothetical protein
MSERKQVNCSNQLLIAMTVMPWRPPKKEEKVAKTPNGPINDQERKCSYLRQNHDR